MDSNLRNRSSLWFIVTVLVTRDVKQIKEQYAIEASSFGDAEKRIIDALDYGNIQMTVSTIERAPFDEVCFNGNADAENWYRVKVITEFDSETGRVKQCKCYHLVQAPDIETARNIVADEIYPGFPYHYEIADIVKTGISEVLESENQTEE